MLLVQHGFLLFTFTLAGTCEVPSFPPEGSTDSGTFNPGIQYIIPTMNFTGCGEITDWTIVGAGGGTTNNGERNRIIELQLFRPDPTQSTVFTEVTDSVVTTSIQQQIGIHTFTSIGFTFSPGDVLGFYYPNINDVLYLEVRHTNSFGTHSVLTSTNSPTAGVVTLNATATGVPLMSVSGELSYLMLVHSVLYSHHHVCGYLLCVVSCTECPRSTTILPTSSEPVEPSSSLNPTSPTSSSTAMSTSSASEYLTSEIACSGQEYM